MFIPAHPFQVVTVWGMYVIDLFARGLFNSAIGFVFGAIGPSHQVPNFM